MLAVLIALAVLGIFLYYIVVLFEAFLQDGQKEINRFKFKTFLNINFD